MPPPVCGPDAGMAGAKYCPVCGKRANTRLPAKTLAALLAEFVESPPPVGKLKPGAIPPPVNCGLELAKFANNITR